MAAWSDAALCGGNERKALGAVSWRSNFPLASFAVAYEAGYWCAAAGADLPVTREYRCYCSVSRATLMSYRDARHNIYIHIYIYIYQEFICKNRCLFYHVFIVLLFFIQVKKTTIAVWLRLIEIHNKKKLIFEYCQKRSCLFLQMKSSYIYIYIHNIGYYIYTVHIGNSHLATSCCLMLFCLMYLCIQTYVNKSLKVKNELSFRMKVKAWVVRLYKHTLVCKCWLHLQASGISVSWDDFGITLQEQPVWTFGRANDCKNSAQKQKHWHYSHIVAKRVNQTMMPFNNNKNHKIF